MHEDEARGWAYELGMRLMHENGAQGYGIRMGPDDGT